MTAPVPVCRCMHCNLTHSLRGCQALTHVREVAGLRYSVQCNPSLSQKRLRRSWNATCTPGLPVKARRLWTRRSVPGGWLRCPTTQSSTTWHAQIAYNELQLQTQRAMAWSPTLWEGDGCPGGRLLGFLWWCPIRNYSSVKFQWHRHPFLNGVSSRPELPAQTACSINKTY
eukprot:scaffold144331_cov21-Tisochrysis_lutea.AAC.1